MADGLERESQVSDGSAEGHAGGLSKKLGRVLEVRRAGCDSLPVAKPRPRADGRSGKGPRLPRHAAIVCALAALILLAPASRVVAEPSRDPARAPAGAYVLDPRRSSLTVKLAYLGGLTHSTVRFTRLSGGFAYDPAAWRSTRVSIAVDPASAVSADGAAGRRVKSVLEPEKHPVIRFTSNGLAGGGADGRGRLEGDLTLHGVTRPILLDIVFDGVGAEPRLRFSGRGRIKRSDFGVTAARPFVGDMLDLAFEVEFVRKQAGP